MARIHLAGIGQEKNLYTRLNSIAEDFKFNCAVYESTEVFSEKFNSNDDVVTFVLSCAGIDKSADIAGHIQVLKYSSPGAFLVLIVNKKFTPEDVSFIKKSGANIILNEEDVYETSFIDYILSQIIRGSLVPIKGHDLKANTTLDFKILTILPLNKKIVPVVQQNEEIKQQKIDKLKTSKELYIARDDIQKVETYIKENQDLSHEGITSRCRINYLNLCKAHADLIFSLFDRSDLVTFSSGKQLLSTCTKIASEMLINLSTLTDPWSIINNSTIGESGSVERAPAMAAMAGLMTVNLDGVNTDETILAGLLCDVGMITLHPSILKKIREGGLSLLTPNELNKYKNHPQLSIEKCLEKKLPLDNKIKNIIMTTHEKFDGSGFPGQMTGSLIPKESQILQYCEFIDQKLLIKMGEATASSNEIQLQKLEEELQSKKILDVSMAFKLKSFLSIVETTHTVS